MSRAARSMCGYGVVNLGSFRSGAKGLPDEQARFVGLPFRRRIVTRDQCSELLVVYAAALHDGRALVLWLRRLVVRSFDEWGSRHGPYTFPACLVKC
jgi:hypothetical protein